MIRSVASVTVKQILRGRFLWIMLPFALLVLASFIGFWDVIGKLASGEEASAIRTKQAEVYFRWLHMLLWITAVYLATLPARDRSGIPLQTILTKKISRGEYLTGRFFGAASFLFLVTTLGTLIVAAFLFAGGGVFDQALITKTLFSYFGSFLLISYGFFLSQIFPAALTVFFLIFGTAEGIRPFFVWEDSFALLRTIHLQLYYLLPSLRPFSLSGGIDLAVKNGSQIYGALAYGLAHSFLFLTAAVSVFGRKEIVKK